MRTEYNGGEWTKARWMGFVKSALRAASSRYPPKYKCLNAAKVGKKINWKSGRLAEHYKCNSCKKEFPQKEVQVDHINAIINPETGFVSWDVVIENMFCEEDNLQVLCLDCHSAKTKLEKELTTAVKRQRKESNAS